MSGQAIPLPPVEVRAEPRACKICERAIQPGQLYLVAGPLHVGCAPRARLNVPLLTRAAAARAEADRSLPRDT